ncbi:tetratricopeptide repeat protein [Algoriphagus sp.]|uniref:tetratricopeptide repeat protein n=1 Tax=Algoriphagus sp. TaxID=1872435 RepID=UPI0027236A23|nr:tetratricopeptide repeat protein [Algoriphagus sp.]MDO8966346.1 tetratricopeptide repeat protein [Algoriphagus sp.]MDP3198227.1 tetratricopeptide repeat protein [Algoriphagus sp.]
MASFDFFIIFTVFMEKLGNQFTQICFLILLFTGTSLSVTAQEPDKLGLEVEKWAVELSKNKLTEVNSLGSLIKQLIESDSIRTIQFLDSLERSPTGKGYFFRTYFCMVKAEVIYAKFAGLDKFKDRKAAPLIPIKEQLMQLYANALDAAYQTEDEHLIGWVNFYSARRILQFGETAWAVMYSKNGVDLFEKINYALEPPVYTELAELLYQVREYDESISYAKKGIAAWKSLNYEQEYVDPYKYKIRAFNTIGSSFIRKNGYDSAMNYLQEALQLAVDNLDSVLEAKVLGNIGKILYAQTNYDSAYTLFKTDYQFSLYDSGFNEAANASQWMAKSNLARGNKVAALAEAKEALQLLKLWPNGQYLRDTYYTLNEIYRSMGMYDSAFFYNDRFIALNDSLEKEVATSSLEISKARLTSEESRYRIQKINKEKQKELMNRNGLMAAIVAVSIIVFLIINRGRLKNKLALEKAESEKLRMEQEIQSAKEQINNFTSHIIEKTNLIERLEEQLNGTIQSSEQQELIAELSHQTILTEDDWFKFKSLFDKIYPTFFQKLKANAVDITVAEQRMAALTRLELSSKQMAAMLGISVDSVHKTRQRLRQRLQLDPDTNLDEYIAGI